MPLILLLSIVLSVSFSPTASATSSSDPDSSTHRSSVVAEKELQTTASKNSASKPPVNTSTKSSTKQSPITTLIETDKTVAVPLDSTSASPQDDLPPKVRQAVNAMQTFYGETTHFEADFVQIYSYATFARQTKSTGTLRFLKTGAAMRWDYKTPTEKSFVVAAGRYFVYDKEAKQIVVAEMESDRISASLSFLWGRGRIDQTFHVKSAVREEFQDGVTLELTPKVHDPRFEKIYFLLDEKNFSVKETLVIDPDGSENHMVLSNVRTDGTFGKEAFKLQPPPDVQVIRFDQPSGK